MKATEELEKFHELSLPWGSVTEFLTSRRHRTSSSAKEVKKSRGRKGRERSIDLGMWVIVVGGEEMENGNGGLMGRHFCAVATGNGGL